tara:strand:+ start:230 stop:574 length:345 start_codon:yes stop_codon:yes gene_type:complete
MKIYLSGPMTGIEDYNYPAFRHRAMVLREAGYEVFNPAETDNGYQDHPRSYYLKKDVIAITECDAVALMEGWENSLGVLLELHVAVAIGLPIYDAVDFRRTLEITEDMFQLKTK